MNNRLPFSPFILSGLHELSDRHARVAVRHLVHGNPDLALRRAQMSVEMSDAASDRFNAELKAPPLITIAVVLIIAALAGLLVLALSKPAPVEPPQQTPRPLPRFGGGRR